MNKIQQHISDQLRTMSECELVNLVEAIAWACFEDSLYYALLATQPGGGVSETKITRFENIELLLERANFKPGETK